jgi:hypothetical protein
MIKALAIKELRESAGLSVVAALGLAYVVLICMAKNPLYLFLGGGIHNTNHLAFIGDGFYAGSMFVVGLFAALLGLKQSAWEVYHNTFYFLFHRPLSRRIMLATKLAVGGLLTFGLLAAAIGIYGNWAAIPGHLAAPFEWSMTTDSWWLALLLVLVYLGGFLSGIRPGRWFGTRLAPLLGAMIVAIFVGVIEFWWLQLPVLAMAYVFWLVTIDHYAQNRDY